MRNKLHANLSVCEIQKSMQRLLVSGQFRLEDVARAVDLSPRSVQRRLAALGTSHSTLLNRIRMIRACQLLSGSSTEIQQIAIDVGFRSPSTFSRAFQRWAGVSPREYRNSL
jgi:transcriptional regulator GlxA family with amidase domain